MSESETAKKGTKAITIDPKEVPEGACHIRRLGNSKVSICKKDGKLIIFEVVQEERED